MISVNVGWWNADGAFGDSRRPEAQDGALQLLERLPDRPAVLGIGEFTTAAATLEDTIHVRDELLKRGYTLAMVADNTNVSNAPNKSAIAVLLDNDTAPKGINIQLRRFGQRNGFIVGLPGDLRLAFLHGDDDHEGRRSETIRGALGVLAVGRTLEMDRQDEALSPMSRVVAIADFNGLSPRDRRPQTRVLRMLGALPLLNGLQFDFYGPNPFKRAAGFPVRAIGMANSGARGLLEAAGLRNANVNFDPTCFHGPNGVFALALDDAYVSPDVRVSNFTQHEPIGDDWRHRISDHNLLTFTLQVDEQQP